MNSDDITTVLSGGLAEVAERLVATYAGVASAEIVHEIVLDSYRRLVARAREGDSLADSERFAVQRLDAIARVQSDSERIPSVLFLCVQNAGRSQMALGWFAQLAGDRASAWSGGSDPGSSIHEVVALAMAEVGIDLSQSFPKPWTDELFEAADVVVTMGCGETCPFVPAKATRTGELDDPSGKSIEEVRVIRDVIRERVEDLVERLHVAG